MAILTQFGRAAMAFSIKTQPIHLAWGNGNPDWEDDKSSEFSFADDQIDLGQTYIKELVIKSQDEQTTYTQGVDYNADSVTGLISRIPAGNIGSSDAVLVSYVVDTPPEDIRAGHHGEYGIGRKPARRSEVFPRRRHYRFRHLASAGVGANGGHPRDLLLRGDLLMSLLGNCDLVKRDWANKNFRRSEL